MNMYIIFNKRNKMPHCDEFEGYFMYLGGIGAYERARRKASCLPGKEHLTVRAIPVDRFNKVSVNVGVGDGS